MGLWRYPQVIFFSWKEACTLEALVTGTSSMANLESCTQDVSFPTPLPNSFWQKFTHSWCNFACEASATNALGFLLPSKTAAQRWPCQVHAHPSVPGILQNNFEISPLPQIHHQIGSWHIKIDKFVRKGMLNWYVKLQPCVLTFPSSWDCWHENAIFTHGSSLMQGLCIGSPDDCHNIHRWT